MTCQSGVSAMRLFDLHNYGSRLVAFGRCTISSNRTYAIDATADIFDLVEQPQNTWQRVPTSELGAGTQARFIGRLGRKPASINRIDVAAGNGLVCIVYEVVLRPDLGSVAAVGIVVVDAASDSTILTAEISGGQRPRCCFVNGTFFITAVSTSTNEILLRRFTPATSSALVTLTSPIAAGAVVNGYDLVASLATGASANTFWLSAVRADSTCPIRGCDSTGAVTYTAAGPVFLYTSVTVLHHDTGGTERLHVAKVTSATQNVDLDTYLPPATVPAVTTLDILTVFGNALCQPGMCLDSGTTGLLLTSQFVVTGMNTLGGRSVNFTTHALSGAPQLFTSVANAKSLNVNGRPVSAVYTTEELTFFTHALVRLTDTLNQDCFRPVAVIDRFLGHELERAHLPSIAYDASTNLAYWIVSTEDEDRLASPQVLELRIAGTDRRQTAQLGDVLYIAGAIPQAFDGRGAMEAGGFLTRPFINSSTSDTNGALDPAGIYQFIAVSEYRDAKNRRMQSAPSNLREHDMTGGDEVDLIIEPSLTFHDQGDADNFTPETMQNGVTMTVYRTLDTALGNGTFHLDLSRSFPANAVKSRNTMSSVQSDTDLSDEPILYTQGARGALSGPLEFVCPDGCTSITASADRILTSGLPEVTRIQESRPLFVGEQVQWNDTAGFFRDVRDRLLAVQRLDERRIIFTATQLFEADGPGVDDNGLGEIGAPRRLPSDVGLYGGVLGWRSIVEISAGILFQGLANQIYLLPRGGVTPVPIGFAIEDTLAAYPDISAAVYMNEDQTVRFCCNNEAGTESIILLFNVRFTEWFVEGPYAFTIRAAAPRLGQFYLLTSANTVLRQRTEIEPLTFVASAWRSGVVHPWKPGLMGRVHAFWFYGTFRGNCRIRAIATFNETDVEEHPWVDVFDLDAGAQFVFRFEFDQTKCESCQVDFEIDSLQSQATRGLDYTYWAIEGESSEVPNELGPEGMT